MKLSFDLSRPDFVFAGVWSIALLLTELVPVQYITYEAHSIVQAMVLFNIVSFFLVYIVVSKLFGWRKPRAPSVGSFRSNLSEQRALRRFCLILALYWLPVYSLTIIYSGGWPLIWGITGAGKTYLDFGVPTLSGLLYMVRAFIFACGITLYLVGGRKRELILPAFFLFTAIGEVSRGGLVVLLLHGIGAYLLMRRLGFRLLLIVLVTITTLTLMFGFLGELRGITATPDTLASEQQAFQTLPVGFFFAYTYLVSPLSNLYFSASALQPLGYPYYTLQPLLPTLVRDFVFQPQQYPIELFSESLNATSFYGPLVADFGFLGACLLTIVIQSVVSYVHVRARRGSLINFLIYPVLFMCTALTVFYLYYFSLVTVIYPLLAWAAYLRFRRHRPIPRSFAQSPV